MSFAHRSLQDALRNGDIEATRLVSSEGFQVAVAAGLREQIKVHLLPSFLTKLQMFLCLLNRVCLLPSGRRSIGTFLIWGDERPLSTLPLRSSKQPLLEALSADG